MNKMKQRYPLVALCVFVLIVVYVAIKPVGVVQSADAVLQSITPTWTSTPTETLMVSSTPIGTPTLLPTVNPTPFGGTVVVGEPLPTPKPAKEVITTSNLHQLEEIADLGEPISYGVSDALFTQDGRRLVVAWNSFTIWQFPDASLLYSLPITSRYWTPMALSPDGQIVAIGNHENEGWVELWNIETQERVRQHQGGKQVRALGFNAAGTILAAGRGDGSVTVWDVETGSLMHQLQKGWTGCMGMAVHPELDQIAASGTDNVVRIWDAGNGQLVTELSMLNPPSTCHLSSLVYRPDGGMLAGAMFWDHRIVLWEGNTYYGTLTHPDSGTIWKVSWSPDGKLLAAIENGGDHGQQLVLWDVESKAVIGIWEQWRSISTFSPDGAMLITYELLQESDGGQLRVMAIPKRIHLPAVFK